MRNAIEAIGASQAVFFPVRGGSFRVDCDFIQAKQKAASPSLGPTCYIFSSRGNAGQAEYKSCILQYTFVCSAFGLMSAAENETAANGGYLHARGTTAIFSVFTRCSRITSNTFLMHDPLMDTMLLLV